MLLSRKCSCPASSPYSLNVVCVLETQTDDQLLWYLVYYVYYVG